MYTKGFALLAIVAGMTLVLVTAASFGTSSVFAAKTGTSHKSKSSSGSNNAASTTTDTSTVPTTTSTSSNKDLKNLFACESTAANGPGGLTKDETMNCYIQAFPANTATSTDSIPQTLTIGNPSQDVGSSSGSDSSSAHHHESGSISTNHTQLKNHHHNIGSSGSGSGGTIGSSSG